MNYTHCHGSLSYLKESLQWYFKMMYIAIVFAIHWGVGQYREPFTITRIINSCTHIHTQFIVFSYPRFKNWISYEPLFGQDEILCLSIAQLLDRYSFHWIQVRKTSAVWTIHGISKIDKMFGFIIKPILKLKKISMFCRYWDWRHPKIVWSAHLLDRNMPPGHSTANSIPSHIPIVINDFGFLESCMFSVPPYTLMNNADSSSGNQNALWVINFYSNIPSVLYQWYYFWLHN